MKFACLPLLALAATVRAQDIVDPECAAKENGAEVFPAGDPAFQQMAVTSAIDTTACTYDITVSYSQNPSLPFMSAPKGGQGRIPNIDVPDDFRRLCDADGYVEDRTQTAGMPGASLDPVNHTGTKEYYTEHSYTMFTSDKVAEMTGVKDVVLGAGTCGQGSLTYPQTSVHFYHASIRDERADYKCVTGGGFFCKPVAEQCSDRGRKFNLDGANGVMCDGAPTRHLPPGYTWTIDGMGPAGPQNNAAAASQGLHAIQAPTFLRPSSIPKHLLLQYDGKLVANHVVLSAGFSMGLSDKNMYEMDFDWDNAQCTDDDFNPLASKVMTEYDPETGRTHVTAHGALKAGQCTGESFTEMEDSCPAPTMPPTMPPVMPPTMPMESTGKSTKSKAQKGKSSKERRLRSPRQLQDGVCGTRPPPKPVPESTCGHQKMTFLEAPDTITDNRFTDATNPNPVPGQANAGDFTVYQDRFWLFSDITDDGHGTTFPALFFRIGKLGAMAGRHQGATFNILRAGPPGGTDVGGYSPNLVVADMIIDHPDHGIGTIKVTGYDDVFGEGELAIIGGTGDFLGAVGTVRPYYGMILMDQETLDKPVNISPDFVLGASAITGDLLQFGFYLDMDFVCMGYEQ